MVVKGVRKGRIHRETKETLVEVDLIIEGSGSPAVDTPVGFLTHMLETFAVHGDYDLTLSAEGDLHVDQHHLVEDVGTSLGMAFEKALGGRSGINRAGFFVYPMDDSVAFVAVDLSGRSHCVYKVEFDDPQLGGLDVKHLQDFFEGFANTCRATIHVSVPYGRSDHHKAEAVFKAFGKAMRMACSEDPRDVDGIPSTKGILD
jgi:imidazoleglycerol-phosphate dehydratase